MIYVRTADSIADSIADMKVPLVKALLFASGVRRDAKHLSIAHCFEKAGFVQSRNTNAVPVGDVDVAATADGDAMTACLEQL